jgi:hypothetical protein
MRLHQAHLPILVQDTKRVPLCLEDNTDSLVAGHGVSQSPDSSLKGIPTLAVPDHGVHSCLRYSCLRQLLQPHGGL